MKTAPTTSRMIYQIPTTRQMILDTAMKLFLERGFFDTQMKDVAEASGLSRTSLYRYFLDKNDLAAALMERVFSAFSADLQWKASLPDGATAEEGLRHYLKEQWLSPRFRDSFIFLAEFDSYFAGHRVPQGFRETLQSHFSREGDPLILEFVLKGQIDGSIRTDADPHLLAVTLLNAVRSLQQRVLLRGEVLIEALPGEPDAMPFVLVDLLMDGLKPTPGGTP